MSTDTDWLTPGAKVVLVTTHAGRETVKVTTVERLTAATVFCADNSRFSRKTLRTKVGEYGPVTELLPYDSPEAQRAVGRMRRRRAIRSVQDAASRLTSAATVKGGDETVLAVLEELDAAVAVAIKTVAAARIANPT